MGEDNMRKFGIAILVLALAGCSSGKAAKTSAAAATPEPADTIWLQEPDMDYDKAKVLEPFNYQIITAETASFGKVTLYLETEKTGYPAQWNNTAYTGNAILVEKNSKQGIYSYDGTELYPLSINKVETPFIAGVISTILTENSKASIVYGFANTSTSKAQIFSSDFKSLREVPLDTFNYNFTKSSSDPYLALKGDTVGVVGMTRTASGTMSGWSFESYALSGVDDNIIVPVINDQYVTTSYAIIGPDGSYQGDLNSDMKYRTGSYVNNCYVISDGTYTTMINAQTGSMIAIQYQDAKYFEDGYAPVKKSGKWGYIDPTGREVTDFIFDDAGTLCNGYAWVYYNGKYGILDFKDAMENDQVQINAYWCSPTDEESIGKLTVEISDLTIRTGAGVSTSRAGICMNGAVYPVFETKTSDGYTWYRINATQWVANDGTWAVYEADQ
jgi:hypothetical protein